VYYKPLKLSADAIYDKFLATFSAPGSNAREAEATQMHWMNYTQALEGEHFVVILKILK